MTLKPCAVCGEPAERNRCAEHRPRRRKASAHSRGYDAAWTKLSARARRLQPFCVDCGSTEGLQTDHSPQAWQRKAAGLPIRLVDVAVVCGECNRRRGAARGGTPSPRPEDPAAQAQKALHTPGGYA